MSTRSGTGFVQLDELRAIAAWQQRRGAGEVQWEIKFNPRLLDPVQRILLNVLQLPRSRRKVPLRILSEGHATWLVEIVGFDAECDPGAVVFHLASDGSLRRPRVGPSAAWPGDPVGVERASPRPPHAAPRHADESAAHRSEASYS
jgi:hypothetical protein